MTNRTIKIRYTTNNLIRVAGALRKSKYTLWGVYILLAHVDAKICHSSRC